MAFYFIIKKLVFYLYFIKFLNKLYNVFEGIDSIHIIISNYIINIFLKQCILRKILNKNIIAL